MECFAEPATPVTTLARDFRFPSNLVVGNGTPRQKAAANLEAIRLLQLLEREQRPASDEEKRILVRYTGWGALPQLFQPSPAPEWQPAATELKELLSEADYAAARASTPNAHYTSAPVITAIWETLTRLGATSPLHILEPSLGIGHFFGLMPDSLAPNTVRVGIELDPLSARIAQFLYPDSQIRLAGFETVALPDGFFDVVVGNVPFGAYPVLDSRYKKHPALTRSIHDYFLAKSVDLVRPGGLLALITSRHTLDKQNSAVREYVASKANLLAAVRLPNGTFRANAGTDVTTDLLFLQRRESAVPEQAQPWLQLKTLQTGDGPVEINEYFVDHPQHMLGTPALDSTQYAAAEFTLKGQFCPQRFADALSTVPGGLYTTSTNPVRITPLDSVLVRRTSARSKTARTGFSITPWSSAMAMPSNPRIWANPSSPESGSS